jgi:RNA polymerase sigma-32 factor
MNEQQLIDKYTPLVRKLALKYKHYGLPIDDLVQEGTIGLITAIRKYDKDNHKALAPYAIYWIKSSMLEYIIVNTSSLKTATTKSQRKLFFNLRAMRPTINPLNTQEAQSIANTLNVSLSDVLEMEKRLVSPHMSLDNEEELSLIYSSIPSHDNPEDIIISESTHLLISQSMFVLDDRERHIIQSRYLTDPKLTLKDLSTIHNISKERVRQVELGAIKKMKTRIDTP